MTESVQGFDFHCHVDLFPDPARLIAECQERKFFTLAVTTTPKAWRQNQLWTAKTPFVVPAIGLHPELAVQRGHEVTLLEELMSEARFVGEIGLDGSPAHRDSLELQAKVFAAALRQAQRLGAKAASIHSRRAAKQVLQLLSDLTTPDRVLPILHWFSDAPAVAAVAVAKGCYFSVNRQMLESASGQSLVKSLPLDRLLTETDAPFTVSERRACVPFDVVSAVELLAKVKGISADDVRGEISANAGRVLEFVGLQPAF